MLLPPLIHAKPLKIQHPPRPKTRLHRPRYVNRGFHIQRFHPALHHAELQRNHPSHLDRPAETNLPVALREMQIPDAELGAGHVDGEIYFRPAGEILDIAVSAVLRATGDRPRALLSDPGS